VNEWSGLFLAVMAVSLAVMAAIQIGLIVVGLRLAKQVAAATSQLQQEIRPIIQKANTIADDAARATALAVAQVERVDQFMASTASRLDETLGSIQGIVAGPVGQGAAALSAFRAVMSAVSDWKGRRRRRRAHEDEDALFVG
jgi:hypothetical protein